MHSQDTLHSLFQTRAMPESHTGVNIAAVLTESTEEWCLQPHPPLVSDNASNMIVAAREFETEIHVTCFAHTLNLACGKALKIASVAKLLGKMRNIVAFFHRSCQATKLLGEKQKLLMLPEHKLIIDVQTRWNSALDMISRFLEQQPAVYGALTSKELRGKVNITSLVESDISETEELVQVLTPLKIATVALCEEKVPTVSLILPLQYQLESFMADKNDDTTLIKQVKKAVLTDLSGRYSDSDVKSKLTLASLIDPRFKQVPFLSEKEKLEAFHDLTVAAVSAAEAFKAKQTVTVKREPTVSIQELPTLPAMPELTEEYDSASNSCPSPSSKKLKQESIETDQSSRSKPDAEPVELDIKPSAMSSLFGDVYITSVEQPKSIQELCELEVSEYKKEPPICATQNPLDWWRNKCEKYPYLSLLARKYLCIPATSVPSERVFSTAGDIVTAQRSQLKSEHVDMLIFLKKNWDPVKTQF